MNEALRLDSLLRDLPPAERVAIFRREVGGRIVFTTSFGLEDQAIFHLIANRAVDVEAVTLDTGRLFRETYDLWAETERRYGRRIRAIYPDHGGLEAVIDKFEINGFYDSRGARLACCHARKVEPLNRALVGAAAWIVGLRANQSGSRQDTQVVTADVGRNILKLSPLVDWTRDAVQSFAVNNKVPVNPLHAQGCRRSAAPHVHGRSTRVSRNVRDAGGGSRTTRRSAGYISHEAIGNHVTGSGIKSVDVSLSYQEIKALNQIGGRCWPTCSNRGRARRWRFVECQSCSG